MVQKHNSYLSLWFFTHDLYPPAHVSRSGASLDIQDSSRSNCVLSDANGYQEQLEENCRDNIPLQNYSIGDETAQNQAPNVSLGQERFGIPEIRLREEGGVLTLCPLTALLSERVLPGSLTPMKEVASDSLFFLSSFLFQKGRYILLTFILSVGVF